MVSITLQSEIWVTYYIGWPSFSLTLLVCFQNVIDGDLCEQFNSMDPHKQKSVSEELDRTPPEVSKKLEDIRTRYAF